MRVAVTGAGGFVGGHVVRAAIARGHELVALVRDPACADVGDHDPALVLVAIDLEREAGLAEALEGCDCVVHLAAVMAGPDLATRTLAMTNNLLSAMDRAGVTHLVLLSSLAVLDYMRLPVGGAVDEHVPVNPRDRELGPYARAKRDQEVLVRAWAETGRNTRLTVLRAGLVYDGTSLADAHAGFSVREFGLTVLHGGEVPVVHVDNVASAVVLAVEASEGPRGDSTTLLLVDDALPDQTSYLKALASRGELAAWSLPVHWRAFSALVRPVRASLTLLGQVERLPDSFRRNSVAARYRPLTFRNEAAKRLLGWQPTASFHSTFPIS